MEFKPVQNVASLTDEKKLITLFQALPLGVSERTLGALAISVNSYKVEELLRDINILNKGAVLIVDDKKQMLFGMGSERLLKAIQDVDLSRQEESVYKKLDGHEVIITRVPSGTSRWSYVSVIPTFLFTDEVKNVRDAIAVISALMLLAGGGLATFLARRNFAPIRQAILRIKEGLKYPVDFNESGNELEFIEHTTASAIRESEDLRKAISKQMPIIQSNLLVQMMKGNIEDAKDIDSTVGINFIHRHFCVLVAGIREYYQNTLEERNLIKFVVGNVMEELGNEEAVAFVVDEDLDRMALILNVDIGQWDYEKSTGKIAGKIIEFLGTKFATAIHVAVGGIHEGVKGISLSYKEAVKVVEYQVIKGFQGVLYIRELPNLQQKYIYPIETEIRLINSIKLGDEKRAQGILDEVFTQNFDIRKLSLEMARCLYFDIMSTAIKVLESADIQYEGIFGDGLKPYERITSCRNAAEMQAVLKSIYGEICRSINENKKSHNLLMKENIIGYLKANFADSNLSLTTVADVFDIHPTYLSNYFKEQVGENFMNYVNAVRLKEVKTLLKTTSMSIQEIARKVGYSNSGVLIRNFKKYEGMTPGEYREKL